MQFRFYGGENHHAQTERRAHEPAQVHHAQRDDEPRVDRQCQQKIHLARAHQFREVRAVRQEKCLVDLLDEIARATSITICHFVQEPMASVCEKTTETKLNCRPNQRSSTMIHKMKLPLKDSSRATEFFHNAA